VSVKDSFCPHLNACGPYTSIVTLKLTISPTTGSAEFKYL
jgi:hypothetical protein